MTILGQLAPGVDSDSPAPSQLATAAIVGLPVQRALWQRAALHGSAVPAGPGTTRKPKSDGHADWEMAVRVICLG